MPALYYEYMAEGTIKHTPCDFDEVQCEEVYDFDARDLTPDPNEDPVPEPIR